MVKQYHKEKQSATKTSLLKSQKNRILKITGQISVAPQMMFFYFYVNQKMNVLAILRKKINPLNIAPKTGGRRSEQLSHLAQTIQFLLFTMIKQVPL